MKDFQIQDNNFVIQTNDFSYTEDISAYVAQKLRILLSFVKGENFLDSSIGIDYLQDEDTNKNNIVSLLMSQIQKEINSCPYVEQIIALDSSVDKYSRTLYVSFTVRITNGTTVEDIVGVQL